MAAEHSPCRHIELPRGLQVRVHFGGGPGEGPAVAAVVRKIKLEQVTLTVAELPAGSERLRGEAVSLSAQLHGRVYVMDAMVLEAAKSPPMLILTTPVEARHAERRHFYRLNCNIEARGTWIEVEGAGSPTATRQFVGLRLIDLGGRGALLRSLNWVPARATIRLQFTLDGDATPVSVHARALRVEEESQAGALRINTAFGGMSRRTEDQIVRFIFRQQALLSRRRHQ
ncbi:MAG: PilZ domain-containing protein [Dehalococcoidia bacterium]|nr:PilZ domain-containing protein [Dehalococcoidia bacterium]